MICNRGVGCAQKVTEDLSLSLSLSLGVRPRTGASAGQGSSSSVAGKRTRYRCQLPCRLLYVGFLLLKFSLRIAPDRGVGGCRNEVTGEEETKGEGGVERGKERWEIRVRETWKGKTRAIQRRLNGRAERIQRLSLVILGGDGVAEADPWGEKEESETPKASEGSGYGG